MNIGVFSTDEVAEVEGIWKPIGGGAELKIARANNPEYQRMLRKEMSKLTSSQFAEPTEEETTAAINKVLSKTVVVGFKNLQEVEGGPDIKYTPEKAEEWLNKYKEFRTLVLSIAMDINNYRSQKEKEVKDNIKK